MQSAHTHTSPNGATSPIVYRGPDHRTQLSTRAMLVSLNISTWSAHKHDKAVSGEIATTKHASANSGRYNKRLLPQDALSEVQAAVSAARKEHYARTLPWMDDGARILSSAAFIEYGAAMRPIKQQFESAVANFIQLYPTYVTNAAKMLGSMYNPNEYPSAGELHKLFRYDIRRMPFPEAADFRADIPDHEVEKIREEIEQSTNDVLLAAKQDVFRRIHEVTAHMVTKLGEYGNPRDGAKRGSYFKESLVTNIRELVGLLPSLNVTNDLDIRRLTQELDRVALHDADELREDAALRRDTMAEADAILERVNDFLK